MMDTNYIYYSNHFPLYVSQAIISSVQSLSCVRLFANGHYRKDKK